MIKYTLFQKFMLFIQKLLRLDHCCACGAKTDIVAFTNNEGTDWIYVCTGCVKDPRFVMKFHDKTGLWVDGLVNEEKLG